VARVKSHKHHLPDPAAIRVDEASYQNVNIFEVRSQAAKLAAARQIASPTPA
jgi:hypothetical protein